MRPKLLDLFCGAGGAAVGYHRAGFCVVGVDIVSQPRYPFQFVKADAFKVLASVIWNLEPRWHAIHASPPCQAYTRAQRLRANTHPDLISAVRDLLNEVDGLPYVIENVPGAPLINPVVLEGQLFGLKTARPRLFETNWGLEQPLMPPRQPHAKMGRKPRPGEHMHVVGNFSDAAAGREAMGIDWMTRDELSEAVPPAYTEFIGEALLAHLNAKAAA